MRKKLKVVLAVGLAAVCCFAFAACGSKNAGTDGDDIVIGTTSVVDKIDPTNSGDPWSLTSDGISETIYMQNAKGKLVSHIAKSIKQKDSKTWELTLKKGVKFSNGDKVDAKAVADCMNEIMKKNEMATASAGVITFTPNGSDKVTLTTERETTVMKSVLCEWTNVIYKKVGNSYVFTGPYKVKKLDSGSSLQLTPNKYYDDNASKRPDVTIKAFKDSSSMKQAFEGGEIDMAFTVTPEAAKELKDNGSTVKDINAGYQYFAITNYSNGATKDINVRKALNVAMNRKSMVKALDGGHVANGFFARYYPFAGDIKETTNVKQARSYLSKAGYTKSGKKLVDKDGKQLTLTLVTYSSRPDLTILMQQTASQLDKLGIKVNTKIVDNIDDYLATGKGYDLAFYAQHTAPTGEPAYALNQFFRTGEGKNTEKYSNKQVDSWLDQMGDLPAGSKRNDLAKKVQAQVAKDLPVIYLVDPQWHVAVSDKLSNYTPYCGDYYIVNPQLGLSK